MFTKNRTILILGVVVALMPFLGFPYPYEEGLYIVCGLSIATLSYLLARHKRINRKPAPKKSSKKEIVDSMPFMEEEPVVEPEITREELLGTVPDENLATIQADSVEISGDSTDDPKSYNA